MYEISEDKKSLKFISEELFESILELDWILEQKELKKKYPLTTIQEFAVSEFENVFSGVERYGEVSSEIHVIRHKASGNLYMVSFYYDSWNGTDTRYSDPWLLAEPYQKTCYRVKKD